MTLISARREKSASDGKETLSCELAVIGAGMAGMAAALFAANRGISVVQVGGTGEILFSSGFIDLMGVHPMGTGCSRQDPWAAIEDVCRDLPGHPYARIPAGDIRDAVSEFLAFLEKMGFAYTGDGERNCDMITCLGTVKGTYRLPGTMWPGVVALRRKSRCLLADFRCLRGYSARQIAAVLEKPWPGIRTVRIDFPETRPGSDLYPEHMARHLMASGVREQLAQALKPHLGDAEMVGMPAIFGTENPAGIASDLEDRIGLPVFEIPTLPPSVPGLRIKEAFERGLPPKGVRQILQQRVLEATAVPAGGFRLALSGESESRTLLSQGVILATGRFFGRGLAADRGRIRESLFDLPVHQPDSRSGWHRQDVFDLRGHPVNQAGLEIDDDFRPLSASGRPTHPRLFAAGSILAHQDWIRMKCGSGLAVATAYAAVRSFLLQRP